MNRAKLKIAIAEAERFLAKVKALPPPRRVNHPGFEAGFYMHDNHPREQGAIKRASMDLTRALADLRKNWS